MKLRNTILVLSGILLMGLVSCTKTNENYQPAGKETTGQVYFDKSLQTSYNISTLSYIEVPVSRVDASSAATVTFEVSADAAFNVPTQASFEAGYDVANVRVTWDNTKLEAGKAYKITMTVKDEGTKYGNSSYTFTCSKPALWKKFAKAHITEGWWGEEENETIWYQEVDSDTWYCYIENCFDTEGGAKPVNFYFTWHLSTDALDVAKQYMGWDYDDDPSAPVYFYDWYSYFTTDGGYAGKWADADEFYAKNGDSYPRSYYDGNGGFYFNLKYYVPGLGGWTPDPFDVVAIAEGFVRTTDFNDDDHIGSSEPAFTANASSQYFSQDGGVTPYVFETGARYTEPEDTTAASTTWYLADYFAEDYCLAFTAPIPKLLVTGAAISDVENDQFTGLYALGNKVYVSIAGGSVKLKENETAYPIFTINMKVYCKDDEGNKTYDFGTVTEVISANGILNDAYTLEDLYGTYLKYYLGKWSMTSYDYFYGTEDTYDVEILEGVGDTLKIVNLSGYGAAFADTLVASYNSSYGILELHPQTLSAQYEGENIKMALFDPDQGMFYSSTGATMYAGMCVDGALAFVNVYSDINACGLFYYIGTNSGLCAVYNIYGFSTESSVPARFTMNKRKEYVTADSGFKSVSSAMKLTRVSGKITDVRNFSLSPVQKSVISEKYSIQFVPESTVNFQ